MADTSVDWELARQVATKIGDRNSAVSSYHYATLSPDFERFTAQAEELVAETTGLISQMGNARGRVADRPMWIDANIESFQRLLKPLSKKLVNSDTSLLKEFGSKASGAEMGMLLGWMSGRVLGQYDLLIIEDENPEDQDIVYYVGPNVLAIEKKYGFPPEEFRLWLALHECTHRAQFTGVPWLRDHFLGLVNKTLEAVDPDPEMLRDAVKRIVEAKKTGEDIFEDGGLPTLFTTPEQRETLNQISGMMSLLEGHGDVTMDRAGAGHVTNADVFAKHSELDETQRGASLEYSKRSLALKRNLTNTKQGKILLKKLKLQVGLNFLTGHGKNQRIFLTLTRSNLQRHGSIESIINKLLAFLTKILKDDHCDQ